MFELDRERVEQIERSKNVTECLTDRWIAVLDAANISAEQLRPCGSEANTACSWGCSKV
jgi:hypothetical protein